MAERTDKDCIAVLTRIAEPLVQALDLVIWGVELTHTGRPTLRLYIEQKNFADKPEPQAEAKSVAIEHCEEISRQLGLALDVEDVFPSAWVLEVSTPGLSRTFFQLEQMHAYIGDVVNVRLHSPYPEGDLGRKHWRGILRGVGADAFTIEPCVITEDDYVERTGSETLVIPWQNVRVVHRVALFPKPPKPGKGPSKNKQHEAGDSK